MKNNSLMASASRFAHFTGLTRASSRRAADDDQPEDDQPKGKRSRAAEDEDDQDEPKGKRSKASDDDGNDGDEPKGKRSKASDDDDDGDEPKGKRSKASDDDDDGDEPKGKRSKASDDDDDDEPKAKGKRSRASDEDEDDDDDDKGEMTGRSATASARRRERARCAAIFGCKAAASNVALAASLAFETTMTRQEAIAVMKSQADRDPAQSEPQGRRSSRQDRNADLSSSDEPGGRKPKAGSSWDRSFKSVGILPRG